MQLVTCRILFKKISVYPGKWFTKIHQMEWIGDPLLPPASTVTVPLVFHNVSQNAGFYHWRFEVEITLPKTLKAGGIQLEYGERNHHHVLPIKKDFRSCFPRTSSLAFESRERVMKVKDISAKWKTEKPFWRDNQLDTCFEFRVSPRVDMNYKYNLYYARVSKRKKSTSRSKTPSTKTGHGRSRFKLRERT